MELRGFEGAWEPEECITLSHPDPKATNTGEQPENVKPRRSTAAVEDGLLCAELAPLSWNVLRFRPVSAGQH